jgi:hypothetical protein
MRPPRPIVALALVAATLGCGTVERVSRPPSPAELARISEASKATGGLTVRYVQPVQPVNACVDLPCANDRRPMDFARLASVDARSITLESEIGRPTTIPLSEVKGVAVNAGEGWAALIGAGIVGGTVFAVTALSLENRCPVTSCAVPVGIFFGLGGAVVGAVVGYAIGRSKGSSKYFSFDPQPKP